MYERRDRLYKKAKEEGKVSRASYKLIELQGRFHLIKRGNSVLDIGAAPGGWSKEAVKMVGEKGLVVAVDLSRLAFAPQGNLIFIQGDIRDDGVLQKVREICPNFDVVISDLSPSLSGIKFKDRYESYLLATRALEIASLLLRNGGNFVTKIFPGEEMREYKLSMKGLFRSISEAKLSATRRTSDEVYLVGLSFLGKETK